MRAVESVALDWLRSGGLEVPRARPVRTEEELVAAARELGPPWVLKPDTAVSGKGLSGRVLITSDHGTLIEGLAAVRTGPETGAVVAEYVEGTECYASVALDPTFGGAVLRVSPDGGVGFDASAAAVAPVSLDGGLSGFQIAGALRRAGILDPELGRALTRALQAIWRAFTVAEASLIEVNPFRWDGERLVAVGVAVEFEDPSDWVSEHYRPTLASDLEVSGPAPNPREEAVARAHAAAPDRPAARYFELDGDVAALVIGGGAGLLVLDRLVDLGLAPSCYVDASPGAPQEKFVQMLVAGLSKPGVRGGIIGAVVMSLMDTQELARAVVTALELVAYDVESCPLVVRLAGPHEDASRAMITAAAPGVVVVGRETSLDNACLRLAEALGTTVATESSR